MKNDTPTPETDAQEAHKIEALEFITPKEWEWVVPAEFARRLERERNEWMAKYIKQKRDLGCEMMDPNGTIWDHAEKLQQEVDRLKSFLTRRMKRLTISCNQLP